MRRSPPGGRGTFRIQIIIQPSSLEIWSETISGGEEVLAWKWDGLFLGYLLGRNYRRRDRDHLVVDAAVCRAEACYPFGRKHGRHRAVKRREFIALLGAAAAAWPLAARAQQAEQMRRIAVLMNNAEEDPEGQARAEAFRRGLQALGWIEGKNLRIDWYWTAGDIGRTRSSVTELAGRPPDIIIANGRVTLSEAVQAIRSIPIIFVLVNDPVGQGFISSLARPGGNVTGFTFFEYSMFGKSLELLKQVAPAVTRLACIFNPDMSAYYEQFLPAFETDARQYSIKLIIARVGTEAEINAAVAKLCVGRRPDSAARCLYLGPP